MKQVFLLLIAALAVYTSNAQSQAFRQKNFNLEKGVALSGYDPVSYFKGAPLKGRNDLSYTYEGIIYRFATAQNLAAFKQNPAGYEPQYGGWCAYAMGNSGEKVEVDPETYKMINGKLYLFYNKFFNNTLKSWNKDESGLKRKADLNWMKYK